MEIGIAGALAAFLGALIHATDEGKSLSQGDLLAALQTAVAYLAGAVLRSPLDVRDAGAQTRATD